MLQSATTRLASTQETVMSAELLTLPLPSGYAVPVRWFAAGDQGPVLLMMPALGVAARFYDPLALALQAAGTPVLVMEQRGHGDSALRPSRRVDFGYREALEEDIPALLDWLDARHPGRPVVLMGHSLGAHYASMTAGLRPARVAGVVICAAGTAWHGAFSGRIRNQLRVLVLLIPLLTRALGYYPGDRVGFGGREASRLMRDWLQLARHNRYASMSMSEDLEAGIRAYAGPVLAVRMQDDEFAPEAALEAVLARYTSADLTRRVLDAAAIGDRADHFRWARSPAAVSTEITTWLRSRFPPA